MTRSTYVSLSKSLLFFAKFFLSQKSVKTLQPNINTSCSKSSALTSSHKLHTPPLGRLKNTGTYFLSTDLRLIICQNTLWYTWMPLSKGYCILHAPAKTNIRISSLRSMYCIGNIFSSCGAMFFSICISRPSHVTSDISYLYFILASHFPSVI